MPTTKTDIQILPDFSIFSLSLRCGRLCEKGPLGVGNEISLLIIMVRRSFELFHYSITRV